MKTLTNTYTLLLAIALFTFVFAQSTVAEATGQSGSELKLKTEKIIIFKDGYCLVLKRGEATTDERGEIFTSQVPDAAVLGSFWATPKDGRMISMVAGWTEKQDEESKDVVCAQTLEILQVNEGKECTVHVGGTKLEGTIQRVLSQETSVAFSEAHRVALDASLFRAVSSLPVVSTSGATSAARITGVSGNYFVLRTEQGDMLLNVSEIRQLTIRDMKTTIRRKVTRTTKTKQLRFRFEKPGQKQEILIGYFRPGARWIPTYRIDLAGKGEKKKTATISLQAEIINEAEDLIDTPIDIVVGVPNFRFRSVTSPFTLEKVLHNTLQQAAPQLMGQFRNDFSNSLYSQRSGEIRRNGARASGVANGGVVELPTELTASGVQDLFVYNLPRLQLRKGERAAVPIFTIQVPYRDVHTWDLHIKRNDIATAPSGSGVQSPLVLSQNKVWRQIELVNNTNIPWTTGAAMIMQGSQPLAQELLTYTSPKDFCRVPVTVAVTCVAALMSWKSPDN